MCENNIGWSIDRQRQLSRPQSWHPRHVGDVAYSTLNINMNNTGTHQSTRLAHLCTSPTTTRIHCHRCVKRRKIITINVNKRVHYENGLYTFYWLFSVRLHNSSGSCSSQQNSLPNSPHYKINPRKRLSVNCFVSFYTWVSQSPVQKVSVGLYNRPDNK